MSPEDVAAREELARGREALGRGVAAAVLDAIEAVRQRPFGGLSAATHREVGALARDALRPCYEAAGRLLAEGALAEAARLEARLGRLLPPDREHEALRAGLALARLRALIAVGREALGGGDVTAAVARLREALALEGRSAPAELRAELDGLGAEVAAAAAPRLSAHARAGELKAARELARALGALPPAWFGAASVATADAFERVARKLMEEALARMSEDLGEAGALARACGELRPPVKLSAAFAEERAALRELYADSALSAAEARLDGPDAGVSASRAVLDVLAPVDWRRVTDSVKRRCGAVLTHARGAARREVLSALERGGPAVRAACALTLLEVAKVEHAEAQFLPDESARREAEADRLAAIHLARACLDGRPDPAPDDRPLRVVEREVDAAARELLAKAVAAGADEDEAAGEAVPLASLLKARQAVDAALATEERELG